MVPFTFKMAVVDNCMCALVTVCFVPYGLQIVFEAVSGKSVSGDIAIDDISYTNTWCTILPSIAKPPTVPPTTPAPIINNCTFESGLCSWTNLKGDQFDWTRSKGGTASWNTGPAIDHTLGTNKGRKCQNS